MFGGLNSGGAENAQYGAELLVKGNSQWREIAPNGWVPTWPVYSQTGITLNQKIFFFGKTTQIKLFHTIFIASF